MAAPTAHRNHQRNCICNAKEIERLIAPNVIQQTDDHGGGLMGAIKLSGKKRFKWS
jgi:hypothetical protein